MRLKRYSSCGSHDSHDVHIRIKLRVRTSFGINFYYKVSFNLPPIFWPKTPVHHVGQHYLSFKL